MVEIDVRTNRLAPKWTKREQTKRVLWLIAYLFFRLSPRPFWGWRRALLRVFGAQIGRGVHVHPTVRITMPWNLKLEDQCAIGDRANLYALGPITVGAHATVSQGAHLCAGTHDWRKPDMQLLKLPIAIGSGAWICAEAFVGPSVTIGTGAVLGARSVAMNDVPPMAIAVGNPATVVSNRRQT